MQRRIARPFYSVVFKVVETATRIRLSEDAHIGPGVFVEDIGPIIISPHVRLGAQCTIANDVGVTSRESTAEAPRIGDRVTLAPGAKVIGPVVVGDDAVVEPNSVVMDNVPAGAHAVGVPARTA